MRVVHERCCGLDVHKKTVVACILITTQATGEVQRHIRTFSTMTAGLLALSDWLESMDVVVIALESTGVYWRPVFNLLEEGRTIILVNAQHIKTVPGLKIANGSPICSVMGCCKPALFLRLRFVNCEIWLVIARPWCKNVRKRSTDYIRC
jgi:Transposase